VTTTPEPDASVSAAALHLLLAQYPDLADLPVEWRIRVDRTIEPTIVVGHPEGERSTRLLAAALEVDVDVLIYGDRKAALRVEGRWGGAAWYCVTYVRAGDAPLLLAADRGRS
jgi:hypothetical protein